MIENLEVKLIMMIDKRRYKHSIGVKETAVKLAEKYGADVNKAALAGLLHDCAKGMADDILLDIAQKHCGIDINDVYRYQPGLLHGVVGAYIVENEFLIKDEEIAHSIKYHTTGCKDMSMLDKIIYLADYIEPGRNFPGVEDLRELTFMDINKGMVTALGNTIKYVIEKGGLIDIPTIQARNSLIIDNFLD